MKAKTGFTLIELLIVIAIILILISIALPNFLEAQVRAKVVRTKGDLRTIATAMQMFQNDHQKYPKDSDSSLDLIGGPPDFENRANGYLQLTTPISYISAFMADPFGGEIKVEGGGAMGYRIGSGSWSYSSDGLSQDNQGSAIVFKVVGKNDAFVTFGVGPDQLRCRNAYKCFPFMSLYEGGASPEPTANKQPRMYCNYAPTNGTTSIGDIHEFGGGWRSGRFMLDGMVIGRGSSPGSGVW